jgi:anaerobic selenocysteine-containing dehydrogenase
MGLLNGSGMDRRFFHRLGASRLDRTICSSAGGAGLIEALGFRYGTEPEQFRHSKLIIAWGANVLGTNVHLWPFIVEARRNGARFYTIDPRRNRTGAAADKHFFINPGSDTALALGMMHVIVGERLYDADYIAGIPPGSPNLPQSVKEYPPERAAALTGLAKRRDRGAGAGVRHHASRRHPPELRRAAQRTRRDGGAHHRAVARADRLVERRGRRLAAFHLAGLSPEPRRAGARRSAMARAGPRGAHVEYVSAG